MKIPKIYKECFTSQKRYIVIKGGSGSAKSYTIAQKVISRIVSEENLNILVIRKVASTIKNSVYQLLKNIIVDENLREQFNFNKSDYSITYIPNGNKIITSGCDDVEKLKSITGIGSVWIEESTELEEGDFDQIILRVRGKSKNIKQFYITFNPIDENHWLKKRFFDNEDDDVFTLTTTYLDNPFLDDAYKKHLTETLKSNENLYKIYTLGVWGRATVGGELFHKFKYGVHVGNFNYNPSIPLHISLDFNTAPHSTLIVGQIEGKKLNIIDEVILPHPNNNTRYTCKEFFRKYGNHNGGLFVYGDQTGLSNDTRQEKGHNDYTIVLQELSKLKPQLRLPTKNPSVVMSVNFINSIFESNIEGITINISDNCKNLIEDLTNLLQDSDGGKLIQKKKDKNTGVTSELYGHESDTLRYMVNMAFAREYTQFQTGSKPFSNVTFGKRAPVRSGY